MSVSPSLDAVLFDMDGVVTDTATAHAAAWKRLFDDFLAERSERTGEAFEPFDIDKDYRPYVDGKPRHDGIRSFAEARGIALPEGSEADGPDVETVHGLGKRKQGYFEAWLRENRAPVYPGTIALIERLRGQGVKTGLFTSSRNAEAVLANAGLTGLFESRVDGNDLAELGSAGKPDPAMLLEAARRLGSDPVRTAVLEDALSGVKAGHRGGFGFVVGVARGDYADDLVGAGADVVIGDVAELRVEGRRLEVKTLANLPSVWHREEEIRARLAGVKPVVFLDYDGTLTPIVEDHTKAIISEEMRAAVASLSRSLKVAIVSGRDLTMLRRLIDLDTVYLAGSHGFEIAAPDGSIENLEMGTEFLPELNAAESELKTRLADIDGHSVERKRFSVAVHYRLVAESDVEKLDAIVRDVMNAHPRLVRGYGKKVFEIQPGIDWNKGRAVGWLLEALALDRPDILPIYIGDDVTDEHAFRALAGRGLTVVVRDADPRSTAADYAVADVDEVSRLLSMLAQFAGNGGDRK